MPLSYVKNPLNTAPVFLGQTIETEEATVLLEYIGKQHGHYIYDLEVINNSEEEIFMAPQFISFYASPNAFPQIQYPTYDVHALSAVNSALTMKRQFANSPAATRKIYSDKVKAKEAGAVLFALLTAGLIIFDVAKDAEDEQKETWTKKDENKVAGRDLLVNVALTTTDIAVESTYRARDENQYVPYELFPECKINPSSSMRGKIFIRKEASYQFSRIVIPIGKADYVFDFKRKGVKSTQSQSPHRP